MILPYDIYTLPTGYTHTGLAQRGDLVVDLRDGLVRLQLLRPHVGRVVLRLLEELAQLRSGVQLNPAIREIGKYSGALLLICVYPGQKLNNKEGFEQLNQYPSNFTTRDFNLSKPTLNK